MNNFLLIVSILVAIYGVYNIIRPFFIRKRLHDEYEVMFLAPKSVYFFIIAFALATVMNISLYIYINFLKDGWYIDGTYFTIEEVVNHGEVHILPHLNFRSIFKVATKNKKSYAYVSKNKEGIISNRIKSIGISKS